MNDVPAIIRQLRLIGFPTGLEAADALMELQARQQDAAAVLEEACEVLLNTGYPMLGKKCRGAALALLKDSPTREKP